MQEQAQQLMATMKQLGCTSREIKIYLHAVSTGPASVQEHARYLRENRVTVHSAIERLIEKGLLYETRKGKRRLIGATEPNAFRRITQQKRNELELMETSIGSAIDWLSSIRKTDRSIPSIKFYEGVDGLKRMLEETLESKTDVLVFTYVDLFSKLLTPKYLENYYTRRARLGIHTRLIFPLGEFGKRVYPQSRPWNMQIRFSPTDFPWKSGIFAWNNTVAIQSFTEGKVTCTIIENEDIAFFYRQVIFELCWKQASTSP